MSSPLRRSTKMNEPPTRGSISARTIWPVGVANSHLPAVSASVQALNTFSIESSKWRVTRTSTVGAAIFENLPFLEAAGFHHAPTKPPDVSSTSAARGPLDLSGSASDLTQSTPGSQRQDSLRSKKEMFHAF